ncbi:hypothetical protein BATDEDRAFT_28562 [Batrachochytrium dendrobatidis JAM81]|uniref:Uncharacterized protein n=1 Tax=Batrachochytrium dendrobatidis (strain JAM81 / FGSC 10211) TaxID=684364 RepID=F4PEF6_BATDJ|nr:uncharacterized protein BATDEDRAFT_28562 [Batrachochytrium dendrobatidis JAM81]XP_006683338.1 uncharacterized protein BATDEDRAFT_28866 [Batrachochytrium dendrobatidis JAM81]XP_006683341.1 uncharacterized protein BATDEDRAFT_28869 [Batrachochytrium dendrobatidis JAM81]EGF76034.1 hypothetical protein BATDEDRAFT_28866 [Batrachochytrium dendrobatidis JAM81]EGF76037.1 hypothetical protein BATDEDRAFT_28869 [Batrachochytrium dendrobatidis JAM81]EGF76420.1 hypothetical protein BATDEDRAFT_28562 [Batr|eukprot:XP_006682969.1 hypothetical protein BATDEDRAFT_28562 [Batrachochytrium dendrobatidis JAM81]
MKFIDITITAVTAIASVNAIAVPESDHTLQARSIPQPNESQVLLERRSPSSYGGWGNVAGAVVRGTAAGVVVWVTGAVVGETVCNKDGDGNWNTGMTPLECY